MRATGARKGSSGSHAPRGTRGPTGALGHGIGVPRASQPVRPCLGRPASGSWQTAGLPSWLLRGRGVPRGVKRPPAGSPGCPPRAPLVHRLPPVYLLLRRGSPAALVAPTLARGISRSGPLATTPGVSAGAGAGPGAGTGAGAGVGAASAASPAPAETPTAASLAAHVQVGGEGGGGGRGAGGAVPRSTSGLSGAGSGVTQAFMKRRSS